MKICIYHIHSCTQGWIATDELDEGEELEEGVKEKAGWRGEKGTGDRLQIAI